MRILFSDLSAVRPRQPDAAARPRGAGRRPRGRRRDRRGHDGAPRAPGPRDLGRRAIARREAARPPRRPAGTSRSAPSAARADLVPRAAAWRPDLVVGDEFELAGPVAARAAGVPYVIHGLGVMPPMPIWAELLPAIDALHRRWGLPGGVDASAPPSTSRRCRRRCDRRGSGCGRGRCRCGPCRGCRPPGRAARRARRAPPRRHHPPHDGHPLPRDARRARDGHRGPARPAAQPRRDLRARRQPRGLRPPARPRADRGLPAARPAAAALPAGRLPGRGGDHARRPRPRPAPADAPQGADQFINAEACTRAGAALALAPPELAAESVAAAAARLLGDARSARGPPPGRGDPRDAAGREVVRALPDLRGARCLPAAPEPQRFASTSALWRWPRSS